MSKFDRRQYSLSVLAGDDASGKLAEVEVKRIDGEDITNDDFLSIYAAFKDFFPSETYKLSNDRKPFEDTVLHVYISLVKEERLKRTKGALGQRYIVPKSEVEKRLKDWYKEE